MRVTSAFTRTIAVTTFASSAVWAPARPAVAVAYPRLARWLARPGGPARQAGRPGHAPGWPARSRARLAGPVTRQAGRPGHAPGWPARSRARLAGRPSIRVPGQSG